MRRRIRRRLGRLARLFDPPPSLGPLEKRLAKVEARLDRHGKRLQHQREQLAAVRPKAHQAHSLLEILSAQLGAMEERLQDLDARLEVADLHATDAERESARSLVEEIREEHRRIRVRFGVVTSYEERIRRLESALAEEIAAATRLAEEAAMHGVLAGAPAHGAVELPEEAAAGEQRATTTDEDSPAGTER